MPNPSLTPRELVDRLDSRHEELIAKLDELARADRRPRLPSSAARAKRPVPNKRKQRSGRAKQ